MRNPQLSICIYILLYNQPERLRWQTSRWACSRVSLVVGSICSYFCCRFMLWVHLHVMLTFSGTICIETLLQIYQDWKLIWEDPVLLLSRFSAKRRMNYIFSLSNSFLNACFLLTLALLKHFLEFL